MLLPAGGLFWGRRIRELVNDEISRAHSQTAAAAGFWVAMLAGLAVYVLPETRTFSAGDELPDRVARHGIALLRFAALEARAHRDG